MAKHEWKYSGMSPAWLGVLFSVCTMALSILALLPFALYRAASPPQTLFGEVAIRLLSIACSLGLLAGSLLLYRKLLERAKQRKAAAGKQSPQVLFDTLKAEMSLRLKGEKL